MLQVFDFDRFGKHDVIGQIKIPMNCVDLAQPLHEWRDLENGEKEEVHKISCQYLYLFCIFWLEFSGMPSFIPGFINCIF